MPPAELLELMLQASLTLAVLRLTKQSMLPALMTPVPTSLLPLAVLRPSAMRRCPRLLRRAPSLPLGTPTPALTGPSPLRVSPPTVVSPLSSRTRGAAWRARVRF